MARSIIEELFTLPEKARMIAEQADEMDRSVNSCGIKWTYRGGRFFIVADDGGKFEIKVQYKTRTISIIFVIEEDGIRAVESVSEGDRNHISLSTGDAAANKILRMINGTRLMSPM